MPSITSSHPTPYSELNEVLGDLTRSAAEILGENFYAACLQGSFAMGDFDHDSDVDFLIITHDDPNDAHVKRLQVMHARIYSGSSTWAQHLEGSYIPKNVLHSFTKTGGELWYLDNGSASLVRSSHCNTVVVRWTVREHGIALAGPDPRSLVDPIPADVLLDEVRGTMRKWGTEIIADPSRMNSEWYQSFAVVSYCRMLHTLETGKLWSKPTSVRWAIKTLDPRWFGLIERAWANRTNPSSTCRQPADPEEVKNTIAFIRYAIELTQSE